MVVVIAIVVVYVFKSKKQKTMDDNNQNITMQSNQYESLDMVQPTNAYGDSSNDLEQFFNFKFAFCFFDQ
jgi:hypothetical protein